MEMSMKELKESVIQTASAMLNVSEEELSVRDLLSEDVGAEVWLFDIKKGLNQLTDWFQVDGSSIIVLTGLTVSKQALGTLHIEFESGTVDWNTSGCACKIEPVLIKPNSLVRLSYSSEVTTERETIALNGFVVEA